MSRNPHYDLAVDIICWFEADIPISDKTSTDSQFISNFHDPLEIDALNECHEFYNRGAQFMFNLQLGSAKV